MYITVTGIRKQGPVIICTTNDARGRSYKIDFKAGKVYGITGKPIKSSLTISNAIPMGLRINCPFCFAIDAFNYYTSEVSLKHYAVIESLLSYPDLIKHFDYSVVQYLIDNYDGKLPKGYTTWCKEKDIPICRQSLIDFSIDQTYKMWPQNLKDTCQRLKEGMNLDLVSQTGGDKELCVSLIRIINNSLKRYQVTTLNHSIFNIIHLLKARPDLRQYMDDTKSAEVVCQILEEINIRDRNERILANEAKISALNDVLVDDDIIIKVPSSMQDFTDEGEQQHNCVGYGYHNSIANGTDLIYFLRKASEPDRSYVTCRYSQIEKVTVEHRTFCNRGWDNAPLFRKIDMMITELLMK